MSQDNTHLEEIVQRRDEIPPADPAQPKAPPEQRAAEETYGTLPRWVVIVTIVVTLVVLALSIAWYGAL